MQNAVVPIFIQKIRYCINTFPMPFGNMLNVARSVATNQIPSMPYVPLFWLGISSKRRNKTMSICRFCKVWCGGGCGYKGFTKTSICDGEIVGCNKFKPRNQNEEELREALIKTKEILDSRMQIIDHKIGQLSNKDFTKYFRSYTSHAVEYL